MIRSTQRAARGLDHCRSRAVVHGVVDAGDFALGGLVQPRIWSEKRFSASASTPGVTSRIASSSVGIIRVRLFSSHA